MHFNIESRFALDPHLVIGDANQVEAVGRPELTVLIVADSVPGYTVVSVTLADSYYIVAAERGLREARETLTHKLGTEVGYPVEMRVLNIDATFQAFAPEGVAA